MQLTPNLKERMASVERQAAPVTARKETGAAFLLALLENVVTGFRHALKVRLVEEQLAVAAVRDLVVYHFGSRRIVAANVVRALAEGFTGELARSHALPASRLHPAARASSGCARV
jgi:hypothetical protein